VLERQGNAGCRPGRAGGQPHRQRFSIGLHRRVLEAEGWHSWQAPGLGCPVGGGSASAEEIASDFKLPVYTAVIEAHRLLEPRPRCLQRRRKLDSADVAPSIVPALADRWAGRAPRALAADRG